MGSNLGLRHDELRKDMDEMKVLGKRKSPGRHSALKVQHSKRLKAKSLKNDSHLPREHGINA